MRNLDNGLLKRTTLRELLKLGAKESAPKLIEKLDMHLVRFHSWLIKHETQNDTTEQSMHLSWHQNRLRTLLHLIDTDISSPERKPDPVASKSIRSKKQGESWPISLERDVRSIRIHTVRLFLRHVEAKPAKHLKRILLATLTRACDALVRDDMCEVSDILFALFDSLEDAQSLEVISEASMLPDIKAPTTHYAKLLHHIIQSRRGSAGSISTALDGLTDLAFSLKTGSPRVEAMRAGMLSLSSALEAVTVCPSLRALVFDRSASPLTMLAQGTETLSQIRIGAHRRLGLRQIESSSDISKSIRALDLFIEQTLKEDNPKALQDEVTKVAQRMSRALPQAVGDIAATVLLRIAGKEKETSAKAAPPPVPQHAKAPSLPPWLPPSRTLGGFYVIKKLGDGGVATVFVAKRSEERHSPTASQYALKIPEYTGSASRTLSEGEFYNMFREEAGALLTLPESPHLARFVTFDAGVRPKPILVMELVEGINLQRVIQMHDLSIKSAFAILDGIAAGLSVLHNSEMGHLDIKPSNVILRDSRKRSEDKVMPVLVDFGLAGRRLRPGCATGEYGAPEIWGLVPEGYEPKPQAADVYAFACLSFEVLSGTTLFEAESEIATITQHISHQGMPEKLRSWAQSPLREPLANVLFGALQPDPRARINIDQFRSELARCLNHVMDRKWPL
ncbi:MAG: protein kinase [Myxococcales bacterium]|nr:MAG: protein kinase [Myxococcales bacterium]